MAEEKAFEKRTVFKKDWKELTGSKPIRCFQSHTLLPVDSEHGGTPSVDLCDPFPRRLTLREPLRRKKSKELAHFLAELCARQFQRKRMRSITVREYLTRRACGQCPV